MFGIAGRLKFKLENAFYKLPALREILFSVDVTIKCHL